MGKYKQTKKEKAQAAAEAQRVPTLEDPTPIPTPKPPTVPAVKKLSHVRRFQREQGCLDIAALCLEAEGIQALMACEASTALVKCLQDESMSVRVQAIRALRNMVICGGAVQAEALMSLAVVAVLEKTYFESYVTMVESAQSKHDKPNSAAMDEVEQDKLDALRGAGQEMEITMDDDKEDEKDEEESPALKTELATDITTEMLKLLTSLTHHSEMATQSLGANVQFLNSVVRCIGVSLASKSSALAVAASECLLVLADENEQTLGLLNSKLEPELQHLLLDIFQKQPTSPSQKLVRVSVASLLWQLDATKIPETLQCLVGYLSEINPIASTASAVQLLANTPDDRKAELRVATMNQLADKFKLVQHCFESLVNIICSEVPDDTEDDEAAFSRTQLGGLLSQMQFPSFVGSKVAEILAPAPPECEVDLRSALDTNTPELQKLFSSIETGAVVLLMNILMVFPVEAVADPQGLARGLYATFDRDASALKALKTSNTITAADKINADGSIGSRLNSLCTCVWTILRKGHPVIDPQLILAFTDFGVYCRSEVQNDDLLCSIVKLLGAALVPMDKASNVNCAMAVGQLCMDCLKDSSLARNLEAMNALIDIFACDEWDDVMKQLNMIHHIRLFDGFLKGKLKVLRKSGAPLDDDVLHKLEIVEANLVPFTQYKAARLG